MIVFEKLKNVTPKEIRWLWKPFIPFGKVTLIQGDTGIGKTSLMLKIIADLSNGLYPPVMYREHLQPQKTGDPVLTYYVSIENGIADCKRGQMENFIKECKSGFDMDYVSSSSQIVNANRVQIHTLAYNLFNLFRRLVLPAKLRKDRIDTVRLKLMKIAVRIVRSARYVVFKLCSSCPFQLEFYETLHNIWQINPLPEV